jgi:hypothetical protein
MTRPDVERKLVSIFITKKNRVVIRFKENVLVEPLLQGDESRNSNTIYTADSDEPPHANLTNALTKLRKLALVALNIPSDSKTLPEWQVKGFKLNGDHNIHQSRVVIELNKFVEWTKGSHPISTPEITMYGDDAQFEKVVELTSQIEDVISECWSYLNGDYQKETGQLPLFPRNSQFNELVNA